jgi:hypothetical protein
VLFFDLLSYSLLVGGQSLRLVLVRGLQVYTAVLSSLAVTRCTLYQIDIWRELTESRAPTQPPRLGRWSIQPQELSIMYLPRVGFCGYDRAQTGLNPAFRGALKNISTICAIGVDIPLILGYTDIRYSPGGREENDDEH